MPVKSLLPYDQTHAMGIIIDSCVTVAWEMPFFGTAKVPDLAQAEAASIAGLRRTHGCTVIAHAPAQAGDMAPALVVLLAL